MCTVLFSTYTLPAGCEAVILAQLVFSITADRLGVNIEIEVDFLIPYYVTCFLTPVKKPDYTRGRKAEANRIPDIPSVHREPIAG